MQIQSFLKWMALFCVASFLSGAGCGGGKSAPGTASPPVREVPEAAQVAQAFMDKLKEGKLKEMDELLSENAQKILAPLAQEQASLQNYLPKSKPPVVCEVISHVRLPDDRCRAKCRVRVGKIYREIPVILRLHPKKKRWCVDELEEEDFPEACRYVCYANAYPVLIAQRDCEIRVQQIIIKPGPLIIREKDQRRHPGKGYGAKRKFGGDDDDGD
ncbi:MAG: hypothetical protein HC913_03865 [Microscillaceae bacterium]|nr:hypothetical protein [Microscillaceae bacterium]